MPESDAPTPSTPLRLAAEAVADACAPGLTLSRGTMIGRIEAALAPHFAAAQEVKEKAEAMDAAEKLVRDGAQLGARMDAGQIGVTISYSDQRWGSGPHVAPTLAAALAAAAGKAP